MVYTVKKLSHLSGVSVRTLHWYDEVGLLKPSFYGNNGYRYYEETQLLILQQILFFRELGFPLKDIQNLLTQKGFDQIKALYAHRKILVDDIDRKKRLIATIDKTILHLKGEETMSDKDLYYGFDSTRQKEYEQYLVTYYGMEAEQRLAQSKKRTANWGEEQWDEVKHQGDMIHKALAHAIDQGLAPESDEVQAIIDQHYHLQGRFFDLTKDVYIGLAQLYAQHPDFKKFFDVYHPEMIAYIGKAIKYYAKQNLEVEL